MQQARILLVAFLAATTLLMHGCSGSVQATSVDQPRPNSRKLIWSDEFNGATLDTATWNFELGDGCPNLCGWGNAERQIYTQANHRVSDGWLTITARKEDEQYTSTRITTENKKLFKYGRIETRAKLPTGKGMWPAFWMLGENIRQVGWPRCGEIDILEYLGKDPHKVYTSLHTQASHGNTVNTKRSHFTEIEKGFHRYATEWTEDNISFFIDDQLVYSFAPPQKTEANWPFDQPFYIILNLAIGGNFGGPEVDDSAFPQEFVIDYSSY